MYVDTHCHLNLKEFDSDRSMVIGNAKKAGVKQFIVPGIDNYSSKQAIELVNKYPSVIYASVGFHPYEAQHDPDIRMLMPLMNVNGVVAIGECGLDYHLYKGEVAQGKKDRQKFLFEEHLRIAIQNNLPVIMHCRDAFEDFFSVIDSIDGSIRGVLHCFSGGLQELREAQKRNFFVGIDGNVTYSKQLQSIVPHIPLSMLVIETDSPYLTPTPHRGQRNEPKYLPLVGKTIASLSNTDEKTVAQRTTTNARELFGIMNV